MASAATNKSIILITGANAGIGFELASQLLADKTKHVIIGSRSLEKGSAALQTLRSRNQPGTVDLVQLNIDQRASIEAAAKKLQQDYGRIDALVNNAGIGSDTSKPVEDQMLAAFRTNAIGPYLMSDAFKPLLKNSITTPRIINVSSGAASIAGRLTMGRQGPLRNMPYCASKTALGMVMAFQATEPEIETLKAFCYCPGFTASTLGPSNTVEKGAKPTSVGAKPMVGILNGARDEESGGFLIGPEMGPEHSTVKLADKLQLPW